MEGKQGKAGRMGDERIGVGGEITQELCSEGLSPTGLYRHPAFGLT